MRFQPVDVPHTSEHYARVSPDTVVVLPTMGEDSIEPFVRLGRRVKVVGCCRLIHQATGTDAFCRKVQNLLRAWTIDIEIVNCAELEDMIMNCVECKEVAAVS